MCSFREGIKQAYKQQSFTNNILNVLYQLTVAVIYMWCGTHNQLQKRNKFRPVTAFTEAFFRRSLSSQDLFPIFVAIVYIIDIDYGIAYDRFEVVYLKMQNQVWFSVNHTTYIENIVTVNNNGRVSPTVAESMWSSQHNERWYRIRFKREGMVCFASKDTYRIYCNEIAALLHYGHFRTATEKLNQQKLIYPFFDESRDEIFHRGKQSVINQVTVKVVCNMSSAERLPI